MIVHDFPQHFEDGTANERWLEIRRAKVTASGVAALMTKPRKTKANPNQEGLSKTSESYMELLLAAWLIGEDPETGSTPWMDRGTEMEGRARCWYEIVHEPVRQVAFIERDDQLFGCSPDSLVGKYGMAQFKVPAAKTHVKYLRDPDKLVDEYNTQIHAEMLAAERQWCDLVSWHPTQPKVVRRVGFDKEFGETMRVSINHFLRRMLSERERLIAMGCKPAGGRCTHKREDGRDCWSKTGSVMTPLGWRCEKHNG